MCLNDSHDSANLFCQKYLQKFGVDLTNKIPLYDMEWFTNLCKKIQTDLSYDLRCLGTLGAGNHYIEINQSDASPDTTYPTVHCGSRNLGSKICDYHQRKIFMNETKEGMKKCLHTEYLEGDEAYEYYFDMIFAQKYAKLNRHIIIKKILHNISNANKSLPSIQFENEK